MACRRERANHALGGIWPQFADFLVVACNLGRRTTRPRRCQAEKQTPAAVKPLWQRGLTGDDAKNVAAIEDQIASLAKEGKFAEAAEHAVLVADIRTRNQGVDHWQSADARRAVDDLHANATVPAEGRAALATVGELDRTAELEQKRGNYAESERINRDMLQIRRKWLGAGHHDVADCYNNIAYLMAGKAS